MSIYDQSNGIAACFHARETVEHVAGWGFVSVERMWVRISGILRGDDGSKEEQVVEADPIIQARLSVDTGGGGGPAGIPSGGAA